VLRAFQLLTDVFGDVRAGLLAQTIHTANTAHLDPRTAAGRRFAGPDGLLPDELRKPISIARLAEATGLPLESTRRIVHRLIDDGYCVRAESGVIIPASSLRRPGHAQMVIANLGYVRKFVRDLYAVGLVDEAAIGWTLPAGDGDDFSLARSVARLTAEYFLRALQGLADTYGDIRSGIAAQTIAAANVSHLESRSGDGRRYAGIDEAVPDEVRRPISIARLAESLGQPYETVRGQAHRLVAAGICVRVEAGLIVPRTILEQPAAVHAMLANSANVRKLVADLSNVGTTLPLRHRPSR
jgi:DNA-binding Lrp family transcriptional regulator